MRSDSKIPAIWTIVNDREYIWWLESRYPWWHKRNYITVKCLKCWLESHIEAKWFWNSSCKCNRIRDKKWTKHWFSHFHKKSDRFYNIYCWMVSRCRWTAWEKRKHLYFWKWIKCEWNSFEEFRDDMYESYISHVNEYWEKNTTLDRIDSNWNYSKSNCRWATCKEQSNNTRLTLKANINWKIYMTHDIAKLTWVSLDSARHRLRNYLDWKITKEKLLSPISR